MIKYILRNKLQDVPTLKKFCLVSCQKKKQQH